MPKPSNQKLLLIAHEASRSGAPILLLTFAHWLKANTNLHFEILLLRGGPPEREFEALAPTLVADRLSGRYSFLGKVRRLLFKTQDELWERKAFSKLAARSYAVVFGNSIVCLPWLARFEASTDARCVCAVHELTLTIERFFDRSYVTRTLPQVGRIVAGSHAVRNNLIAVYAVPPDLIQVVHSFVNEDLSLRRDRSALRRELGLGADDVVISGVGNSELRKGLDLLPTLALALTLCNPERRFKFVWLGGKPGDDLVNLCRRDAEILGVGDRITYLDANPDANDYIDLCDVFVLPSREDPFPLVVLTAIRMGKPVVAIEQSGGMDEFDDVVAHGRNGDIYNIGCGVGTDIRQLVERMRAELGLSQVDIERTPMRPFDVRYNVLDSRRLQALNGWAPRVALGDGIQSSADWLRQFQRSSA